VDSASEPEQPANISMIMRINDKNFHCIKGLSILQQTHAAKPYRFDYNVLLLIQVLASFSPPALVPAIFSLLQRTLSGNSKRDQFIDQ
jgi:hypothetical protein